MTTLFETVSGLSQRLADGLVPQKDLAFATSLVATFKAKKTLSEKQAHWAAKLGVPHAASAVIAVDGVLDLFAQAKKKLKFPKLRLAILHGIPVTLSLAGGKAAHPDSVNVKVDGEWIGRVLADGTVNLYRGQPYLKDAVVSLLVELAADPVHVAANYGKMTSHCCFCHRPLSDDRSLDVGYGPVCATNWGLPWGVE